jgi:hypothetical protein
MTTAMFRTHRTETAGSGATTKVTYTNVAAGNSPDPSAVYSLPSRAEHGTQPQFWSEVWRRKEQLADWDSLVGNVFEADDVEDLIRTLHAAAAG